MANYLPQNSGLWSTTTWITAFSNLTAFAGGNTPPTVIDDVYADGKTITVDINTAVRTIRTSTTPRTGGLAGGGFRMNNGISLSANVIAGTTTCLSFLSSAPSTCTLFGGVTGGTASFINGFNNNSTGTVFIYGSEVTGGTGTGSEGVVNSSLGTIFLSADVRGGQSTGLNNNSTGFVFITGNVFGSQIGGNIVGLNNNGTCTIYGNIAGGPQFAGGAGGNAYGVNNGISSSVLTVYGNVSGARLITASGYGIFNNGGGRATIFGDVFGIASPGVYNNSGAVLVEVIGNVYGGGSQHGIQNNQTGTVNITGSSIGGIGANLHGVTNVSTGTVNIYGAVLGGQTSTSYGVNNSVGGQVYVYGNAIGSNLGAGANNAGTGLLYITKVVGNNFGLGTTGVVNSIVGASNSQNGRMYVEQFEFGPRGQTPISGPVYILPSNRNTLTGVLTALGNTVTFYNSLSVSGLMPPASSVRLGTVYNVGNSVGTMAVPSAGAVQFGVPVDNTVGVAALTPQTVWGYSRLSATDVGSMGDRLRNAATSQSVGSQIASFNL
jgi:hypothetical protein